MRKNTEAMTPKLMLEPIWQAYIIRPGAPTQREHPEQRNTSLASLSQSKHRSASKHVESEALDMATTVAVALDGNILVVDQETNG